jgi:hypothetical protein
MSRINSFQARLLAAPLLATPIFSASAVPTKERHVNVMRRRRSRMLLSLKHKLRDVSIADADRRRRRGGASSTQPDLWLA